MGLSQRFIVSPPLQTVLHYYTATAKIEAYDWTVQTHTWTTYMHTHTIYTPTHINIHFLSYLLTTRQLDAYLSTGERRLDGRNRNADSTMKAEILLSLISISRIVKLLHMNLFSELLELSYQNCQFMPFHKSYPLAKNFFLQKFFYKLVKLLNLYLIGPQHLIQFLGLQNCNVLTGMLGEHFFFNWDGAVHSFIAEFWDKK